MGETNKNITNLEQQSEVKEEQKKKDVDIDQIYFGYAPKRHTVACIQTYSELTNEYSKKAKINAIASVVCLAIASVCSYKLNFTEHVTDFYTWLRSFGIGSMFGLSLVSGISALAGKLTAKSTKQELDRSNAVYVGERLGNLEDIDFSDYDKIEKAVFQNDFETANRILDTVEEDEVSIKGELKKWREMAIKYSVAIDNNDQAAMTTIAAEFAKKGRQLIPDDEEEKEENKETEGPKL